MSSAGSTIDVARAFREAVGHHQAGRLAEAERLYRDVLAADAENADALHLLGVLAQQLGRPAEGLALIERAVERQPGNAIFLGNLGVAYREAGRLSEAERALRAAIVLAPDQAKPHADLGETLRAMGRVAEAELAFARAAALQPSAADVQFAHANALKDLGRTAEAEAAYARTLVLQPHFPEAHNNRGIVLAELGRVDEAERSYRLAIAIRPTHAFAWHNLGNLLRESGRHEESEDCYRRAVEIRPDLGEPHAHLGNAMLDQARLEEGERCHRRALELDTANPRAWSNLLLFLNYVPGRGAAAILAEHRRYGALFGVPSAEHANTREPDRPLRVGYLSGDFRAHSVAAFFEPLLERHDRTRFHVTCYHNHPRADAVTARLRALAGRWRDVYGWSDDALERAIRSDSIDLLVDLSGHTAFHRLPVFARRPAPVQISYLGYPGPSGLPAMDYHVTDALCDPPGVAEAGYDERLLRLPRTMWCYRPADADAPPPAPRPADAYVVFGSFNYFAKLNDAVIDLWTDLMARVPGSRLLVTRIPGPRSEAALRARFAAASIGPERLELHSAVPRGRLRELFAKVDIGLDPFPYAGTTTTCDALWAGIPVITLSGETTAARSGASLLAAVGLGDLVARSPAQYVAIAAALAADRCRLRLLRAGLRDRMQSGPLMDAGGLAECLEAAYLAVWRRWCERAPSANVQV